MSTNLVRRSQVTDLDPWATMREMESRMWDWLATPFGMTPMSRLLGEARSYVPPVDVVETADDVTVTANLPGIDASSVEVELRNGVIAIAGKQASAAKTENADNVTYHVNGIPQYGTFSFQFTLPCEVEGDRAEARYTDGVLRIRFPKAAKARATRILVVHDADPKAMGAAADPASEARSEGEGAKS